jgi:hypothetical protein
LSPQPFFLGLVDAALRRAYPDYVDPFAYPNEQAESSPAGPAAEAPPRAHPVERV